MRSVAVSRVWIVALVIACRSSGTTHVIAPPPPAPSLVAPMRSTASVAPVETPSQDSRDDWSPAGVARYFLREGTFPTREETFRPGLIFEGALEGDIERDGSQVQLASLEVPHDQRGDGESTPERVLVYLRHTTAGWHSELFPVYGIYETYWRRPIVLAGRSVFVASVGNLTHSDHLDADGDGVEEFFPGGVTYLYSLASRGPDGHWFVFEPELDTQEYYERCEFDGLPDGSLLVTSSDGRGRRRWQVMGVDWAARRILTPDNWQSARAWSRGAPPASVPRPPVARMEGVTCRVVMDAPFQLRRGETSAPTGLRYPLHTNVLILGDTRTVRGDARLYRVRIVTNREGTGAEGYAFVRDRELGEPCPLP